MSNRFVLTLCICGTAAIAATLAACDRRYDDRYRDPAVPAAPATPAPAPAPTTVYVPAPTPAPDTTSNTTIVTVTPETYPEREYFFEPSDTGHVYFYEKNAPDTVVYRETYRDGSRTYYVERDGRTERHVYFDDGAARRHRWERAEADRERLRREARDRWERERADWNKRNGENREERERLEREQQKNRAEQERLDRERRELEERNRKAPR
jgi:hypothetical protein